MREVRKIIEVKMICQVIMSINFNARGLLLSEVVCITLKHRQDRRIKFKRDAKKKSFPVTFYKPEYNSTNPELGKWKAHLQVWKNGLRNDKCKVMAVFEDDARILTSKLVVPKPPTKWDMLYLGGNIQSAYDDEETNSSTLWKRVSCLMTHSYIVNKNTLRELVKLGTEYLNSKPQDLLSVDRWLCLHFHPSHNVYITTPEYVIQRDDYSDTKKCFITYNQQLTARATKIDNTETGGNVSVSVSNFDESTMTELQKAPMEYVKDESTGDTSVVLKLPNYTDDELPSVTLITPTRNNKSAFYFVVRNFYKLNYPKEKLTWIIVDDSELEPVNKSVKELIPGNDPRIKYISCKMQKNAFLSVSKKLNMAMSYVNNPNELVAHFFDDQYYHPMSLLSRVKVLLSMKSQGIQCVGCTEYGIFDIVNNRSYQKFYPDIDNNKTILYCPSLCYTRDWWMQRSFDETKYVMESFFYTKGRMNQVVEIPYQFITFQLVAGNPDVGEADRYGKNITELKKEETSAKYTSGQHDNFFDSWDMSTQNFILLMKETLDEN